MITKYREAFNQAFQQEAYDKFLAEIHPKHNISLDFRIAETPVFASEDFKKELLNLFDEVKSLVSQDGFAKRMERAVPEKFKVPNENKYPHFIAIDAAICQKEDGTFYPQLIEFQGVASLYCYQRYLSLAYQNHFNIPSHLSPFLHDSINHSTYVERLKKVIIGDNDPENVILLDIKPKYQKTRVDFLYTMKDLGIKPVCISEVIQEGEKIYYKSKGRKIPIHRIYNRLIFDELEKRTDLDISFDFKIPIDAEWVAHPNWFFKLSKYTMPFFDSDYVPKTFFLHELEKFPEDLENYVLKPLFSFAGAGVHFDVTNDILTEIKDPENYILQKKVAYAPFIPTKDINNAKAEVRMLCVWDDELIPLISLARLSKGKILGVDFNKDKTWVGSSAVFFGK